MKHRFPVSWLCRVLEISRSSYYKWIRRRTPQYERDDKQLKHEIEQIFTRSNRTYGYRRVYIYLRLIRKLRMNHKRVYRLMDQMGWKAVIRRKPKRYVRSTPQMTAENILNRQFDAAGPNQKWVTDVTEFRLATGQKAYLSAIYDLGSGRIVSHVLGHANNNRLVFETFHQDAQTTDARNNLFHSDQGFQYTSRAFQKKLKDRGFASSMSRVGRCIDNGPMEGVWSIIKCEMYHLR